MGPAGTGADDTSDDTVPTGGDSGQYIGGSGGGVDRCILAGLN